MFRLRVLTFAGCTLIVSVLFVQAQDAKDVDLKAVMRKAIEAHGGEKKLQKAQAMSSKFKGTMKLNGVELNIVSEQWVQKPSKFKKVMTLEKDGKSVEITQVFDGKTFWVSQGGNTREIDDEKILNELRQALQAESGASFIDYLKAPYELSAVGEVKVKGKDAVGIRVSKKDQRDVSYFFDKKTHLVIKIETRGLDPTGQKEATQEKFVMSYQEKSGMKVAKNVVIHMDGEPFMDIEILDVQILDKLDDATFAKP